ncbi:hypothetical protein ACHAXA_011781 [Cyclostephanos tholiformis]|uniref:Peptidase M16 C-terminal domain-containing protein n=1 Tax=Cyclostephanos tholiformis TaxID=382380 RepID=A0ABD3R5D9_9STRA
MPTTPSSYVTTRVSGTGSRYDRVGGESAILARAVDGGRVGRECVTFPSMPSLDVVSDDIYASKSGLISEIGGMSHRAMVMDRLHETAYQTSSIGNSLGSPLSGTSETVSSLTAGDVRGLLTNLRGDDVVVVGTGSGEHDRLVDDAQGDGTAASGGGEAGQAGDVTRGDIRERVGDLIRYDSHGTATVALAFAGASHADPKAMPLALMRAVLGSYATSDGLGKNIASSMCQEVADHGLASSISAFNLSYSDAGLFGVVMTAPDNKLDDLLWYVMPNLVRLAHGISDEELARAKLALKASICSAYDGDIVSGETMATQIQTIGRVMSLAEALVRVDALTMADIKATAGEVINDQDHALAAIGGIHELPDYNWIRRHSYMLRY